MTAALAARSAAVRLFLDRATAAQPAFAMTDQNAAAVVQLCRRLDGMPLALELAAARVRALPVEQIAARLDDRFRLLTGGSRMAVTRHQTLRATMDWSHDLLAQEERRFSAASPHSAAAVAAWQRPRWSRRRQRGWSVTTCSTS